jgi:hypothetical protein
MKIGAETNYQIETTIHKFIVRDVSVEFLDVYNDRKTTADKAFQ